MSGSGFVMRIKQGLTYVRTFEWRDADYNLIDVTGMTATLKLSRYAGAPAAMFTLDTSDGITMGGAAGTVTVTISEDRTALLSPSVPGVFDIVITDTGGQDEPFLEGPFRVEPG